MSKAEEIEKMNEYIKKHCSFTPHKTDDPFGVREAMKAYYNSRQSEIDTINNSVKIYNEVIDDQKREIDELRAEVERLNKLSNDLFSLWESLAEIGEIHIGVGFSSTYNNFKAELTNKTNEHEHNNNNHREDR